VVRKQKNGQIFHDQIGHWIYEPSTGLVMHSLTIPRGICLLAGGKLAQNSDETIFEVEAKVGNETFGIVQSPFMVDKAKTTKFTQKLTVNATRLSYSETTMVDIYGKTFTHTDDNVLERV
jgi:hypothetical protein